MIAYLALFGAAATAFLLARRDREHWPIAALLVANLVASLIRAAIAARIDASALGELIFHVDEALFLIAPLSLATVALVLFARAGLAWAALPTWGVLVANLCAYSDKLDATRLARFYLAIELAALLVCAGAIVHARRAGRLNLRRLPHLALALVVGVEALGVVLGPWRYGIWARWDLAQLGQVMLYSALALLQGGALVLERRR